MPRSPDHPAVTKIVLLGTGTPNAEPDRSRPSVAVVVNDTPYLVDFGPGVVRRAVAAFRSGIKALEPKRLKRAFATHLHSDHTAGYPDLILTPWVLERDEPLEVYGPEGIRAMTEHILAAYQEDIDERLHGLEPANDRGYLVNAHEIEPGIVYRDSNVAVSPGSRASLPARTPAGIVYRDSNVTVSPGSRASLPARTPAGIIYRDSNVTVSPGSRASLPARTPVGIVYRDSNVTVSPGSRASLPARTPAG
ncbi:MAG: MBL fold metallo-hydrolase, partial [Anaerolineae bacterium]|nr:MBL fold metallo-hydrolase [Anaerolineae bacterium]